MMNKKDIVKLFATGSEQTMAKAEFQYDVLFEVLAELIRAGEEIRLPRIGTLYLKKFPARKARNPKTGETVQVAPRKRLAITPVLELRRIEETESS